MALLDVPDEKEESLRTGTDPSLLNSSRPLQARGVRPVVFRFGLVAILLVQVFAAIGYMHRDQVNFSSDQAVPALMALEIRDLGRHPVFYWGVQYDGSLEPHLLSLAFRVLPATVGTYRLVMLALMAAATIFVSLAAAEAFGRLAGLLAGAYLAAGPSFLYFKLLGSDGAYTSFFMLTAASVWLATLLSKDSTVGSARFSSLALGLVLGVAWWVTPLSIVLVGVMTAAVAASPRAWFRPARLSLTLSGFLLGASPWIGENLRTNFASLRSNEMAASSLSQAASQVRTLATRGLPVLLGGRSPGGRIPTFPGSENLSVVLFAGLVVAGIATTLRKTSPPARFLALASTFLLVAPAALALSRARTDLREDPRFLLSSFVGVAILGGVVLAFLIEHRSRLGAVAFTALLLLLGPLSQLRSPRYRDDPRHGRIAETEALAARLANDGIRDVYAEYWIAYRLTFLSRGRLVASPFGEGAPGPIRDIRAYERVESVPSPAFLLEPEPAVRLRGFLESRSVPFRHECLPDLGRELIWEIPAAEMVSLRACRCLWAPGSAPPNADPAR